MNKEILNVPKAVGAPLTCASSCARTESRSTNLKDIDWDTSPEVHGIPARGQIELIIDMYQSMPLVMKSKGTLEYTTFNLPTGFAANLLLLGPPLINKSLAMASSAEMVKEGAAKGEAREWIKLAYSLTRYKGRALFAAASGGDADTLLAATPTMVLLTPNKAFIVVSFKPGTPDDAQLLCALELSRTFREYTNFHLIHSANIITKDDRAVFNASVTVVSTMLKSYINSVIEGHEATYDAPDPNDVDPEPVEVEPGEPIGEPGSAGGEPSGEPVGEPVGF
jgi:hypothetical protein